MHIVDPSNKCIATYHTKGEMQKIDCAVFLELNVKLPGWDF